MDLINNTRSAIEHVMGKDESKEGKSLRSMDEGSRSSQRLVSIHSTLSDRAYQAADAASLWHQLDSVRKKNRELSKENALFQLKACQAQLLLEEHERKDQSSARQSSVLMEAYKNEAEGLREEYKQLEKQLLEAIGKAEEAARDLGASQVTR